MFEPVVRLCAAWLAAAEGTVSRARATARDAAAVAARTGQSAVEVVALHTAVRFGDRTCGSRLRTLASRVDGPRVQLAARHAQAWADRDAARLSTVSSALADTGLLLIAAEAAAQGAIVYRESGDLRAEQTALAQARRLLAECEGADTPALREALRPSPLTEREREVAALVAAGHSNRQIAERLVVSVRTVEGHVYRACVKLGVADRAALAELTAAPAQDR
ncbi:MAG: helix-turn-helix transcriptional regulator [Catenulispora sp.]|nr:helix-turn-helix transcriptional regulator [Catenulispora sp.]